MRGAGTHLLLAYLIAFLASGAPAAAAPRLVPSPDFFAKKGGTRLLVVVAPLDARAKAQAGQVEQTVEAAVDASDRFEAVRGFDAFDPSAAAARASKEVEARKLMAEAKQALDDLDSAKAAKLYTDSIAAWQQADLTRGIEGLVEAWTGKAAGHSVSEENKESKAELEKVLVLAPRTKFSDAQFPPELLKYAEGQRKQILKAKGKLTVRTEPPGARVFVDGAFRGVSPLTIEPLANGKHMVAAALSGYGLVVDDLPLGDGLLDLKPAELSYQLNTALGRLAKDPDGPPRDAAARELGDLARADQVLLVTVKQGSGPDGLDATALRLDVKDGHNFAYAKGALTRELLQGLLSTDDPREGKKPTTHFAGGGSGGVGVKRILGFALLGGAVVAGVSWAVFGLGALGRASQFQSTLQVEAMKSSQAAMQGRTFALAADISWAVGAALLLVGVLLAFTPLGASGGGSASSKPKPKPDDALEQYRRQQEEQRLKDAQKPAEEEKPAPPPEEQKPDEAPPKPEEKKPDEKVATPPPEEKKKLTPAEERAEKKRKAAEEKAERKRKAAEEKAEKKRKAEEEKQRKAEEKKKADEEKKRADEEKKKADEDKQRAAEDEKKKKASDAEQKKKDEEDARRLDEERKQKEKEEEQRRREEKPKDRAPERKPAADEEDLRNF